MGRIEVCDQTRRDPQASQDCKQEEHRVCQGSQAAPAQQIPPSRLAYGHSLCQGLRTGARHASKDPALPVLDRAVVALCPLPQDGHGAIPPGRILMVGEILTPLALQHTVVAVVAVDLKGSRSCQKETEAGRPSPQCPLCPRCSYHGADDTSHIPGVAPPRGVTRRVLTVVEAQVQQVKADVEDVLLKLEPRENSPLSPPHKVDSPKRTTAGYRTPLRAVPCPRGSPRPRLRALGRFPLQPLQHRPVGCTCYNLTVGIQPRKDQALARQACNPSRKPYFGPWTGAPGGEAQARGPEQASRRTLSGTARAGRGEHRGVSNVLGWTSFPCVVWGQHEETWGGGWSL